jgi:hypothetical protein
MVRCATAGEHVRTWIIDQPGELCEKAFENSSSAVPEGRARIDFLQTVWRPSSKQEVSRDQRDHVEVAVP